MTILDHPPTLSLLVIFTQTHPPTPHPIVTSFFHEKMLGRGGEEALPLLQPLSYRLNHIQYAISINNILYPYTVSGLDLSIFQREGQENMSLSVQLPSKIPDDLFLLSLQFFGEMPHFPSEIADDLFLLLSSFAKKKFFWRGWTYFTIFSKTDGGRLPLNPPKTTQQTWKNIQGNIQISIKIYIPDPPKPFFATRGGSRLLHTRRRGWTPNLPRQIEPCTV